MYLQRDSILERAEINTDPGRKKPQNFVIYSPEQAFRHMTEKRSEKERELYIVVDEILFNVWDALCLSMEPDCREEYLPYLPHTYELLMASENGDELWQYLVYIEETKIGVLKEDNLTRRRADTVVDILMNYKKRIFAAAQE